MFFRSIFAAWSRFFNWKKNVEQLRNCFHWEVAPLGQLVSLFFSSEIDGKLMSNKRFAFLCQDDGSYHNIRFRYAVHQPNASKPRDFRNQSWEKLRFRQQGFNEAGIYGIFCAQLTHSHLYQIKTYIILHELSHIAWVRVIIAWMASRIIQWFINMELLQVFIKTKRHKKGVAALKRKNGKRSDLPTNSLLISHKIHGTGIFTYIHLP